MTLPKPISDRALLASIDSREYVSEANLPKLYMRASSEGRLYPPLAAELNLETGTATCGICGMTCWDEAAAARCCVGGEVVMRVAPKLPTNAVAMCTNRALFRRATRQKMVALRFDCLHHMSIAHNLPMRLIGRLQSGESRVVQAENWGRLCGLFGGTPPGMTELRGGSDE